jgi:hypothetical protein
MLAILLFGSLAAAPNGAYEYINMKMWQAECMFMYVEELNSEEPIDGAFDDVLSDMDDVYGDLEICADAHDVACFREVYREYVALFNEVRPMFLYFMGMWAMEEADSLEEFLMIMSDIMGFYSHMNEGLMECYMMD